MTTKKIKATKTAGKLGYAAGVEMTPVGDVSRIIIGKDPYTGEWLTDSERMDAVEDFAKWNVLKPVKMMDNSHFPSPLCNNEVQKSINKVQRSAPLYLQGNVSTVLKMETVKIWKAIEI